MQLMLIADDNYVCFPTYKPCISYCELVAYCLGVEDYSFLVNGRKNFTTGTTDRYL